LTGKGRAVKFEVPVEWASAAITECAKAVLEYQPAPGRQDTFEHGGGLWEKRGTSNYFNSGCNQKANTPTGAGDVGTLSLEHMQGLEEWFRTAYKDHKPNVLKGDKWNFTLTHGTSALNFHMEVS
jgi:hypothetical protein